MIALVCLICLLNILMVSLLLPRLELGSLIMELIDLWELLFRILRSAHVFMPTMNLARRNLDVTIQDLHNRIIQSINRLGVVWLHALVLL
jgi:hypothetical protein